MILLNQHGEPKRPWSSASSRDSGPQKTSGPYMPRPEHVPTTPGRIPMRCVRSVVPFVMPAALAAQTSLRVTVFEDRNGNGTRDAGERAIPSVVISNQLDVATTDASGTARIERSTTGIVFV